MSEDTTATETTQSIPPVRRAREKGTVHSKARFAELLAANLTQLLGVKVSRDKAWKIYKACMFSSFQLASEKPLSLSGVGKFHVLESQRSVQANKPALRMRFTASSKVNDILNGDKMFFNVAEVQKETPDEAPGTAEHIEDDIDDLEGALGDEAAPVESKKSGKDKTETKSEPANDKDIEDLL